MSDGLGGLKIGLSIFAFILLASSAAWASQVALVADHGTYVQTACVSYTGTKTAAEILHSSGLGIEAQDDGPLGELLCRIGGTGCPAINCFCGAPNYWAFFYSTGGAWTSSDVGISSHQVSDGEILGFRWTDWNLWPTEAPEWRDFAKICTSSQREGPRLIRHFDVNITNEDGVQGGKACAGAPVSVKISSVEEKAPIWDVSFNDVKREVFWGAAVKIFHKNGWWDVAESGYADKKGYYSFTPALPGLYSIEISKSGFVHSFSDLNAEDCTPVPECSLDSNCSYDETCSSGECKPVSGNCGIAQEHKFIEYACCSDSACGANSRCEDHLCVRENRAHLAEVMRVLFNIYYIS